MTTAVPVSAYPTEADARAVLPESGQAPYLGIWLMPEPWRTPVHVFSDLEPEWFQAEGWTREDT